MAAKNTADIGFEKQTWTILKIKLCWIIMTRTSSLWRTIKNSFAVKKVGKYNEINLFS